jgi:hypothetical protein
MQTFDVYFLGELAPGADRARVQLEVARLFKISPDAAQRLFSGRAVRVKQGVDVEVASRYRAAFRDAGALLQIVPAGDPPPSPAAVATAPTPVTPVAAAGVASGADATGMQLAEPGATIDETPPPPVADIDTSGLSAMPANTGSLEDCKVEKPPHPIPDISHLEIVDA